MLGAGLHTSCLPRGTVVHTRTKKHPCMRREVPCRMNRSETDLCFSIDPVHCMQLRSPGCRKTRNAKRRALRLGQLTAKTVGYGSDALCQSKQCRTLHVDGILIKNLVAALTPPSWHTVPLSESPLLRESRGVETAASSCRQLFSGTGQVSP